MPLSLLSMIRNNDGYYNVKVLFKFATTLQITSNFHDDKRRQITFSNISANCEILAHLKGQDSNIMFGPIRVLTMQT